MRKAGPGPYADPTRGLSRSWGAGLRIGEALALTSALAGDARVRTAPKSSDGQDCSLRRRGLISLEKRP